MHSTILEGLDIQFSAFGRDGILKCLDTNFWTFFGMEIPQEAVSVYDMFPELIGLEDDIDHLFETNGEKIKIPSIQRDGFFFDLSVFSPLVGQNSGMIVVQDRSKSTEQFRSILQKRNELSFLTREINHKNVELAEARKILDDLVSQTRNRTHELSFEVHKKNKELKDTRLWFINTLARAAEFREHETGGHLYRIGRSSVLIGRKMGLSVTESEVLFYASLLHDVGKIGIPDAILIKPEPLSPEEWAIMKTHTTIGANLLSRHKHPLFIAAHDVALNHHERWDGTGYPAGLKGHEIPLVARICSVADVYDALVSKRIYKNAWEKVDASNVIINGAGKQFDPKVVNAFIDVLPEIQSLSRDDSDDFEELEGEFL